MSIEKNKEIMRRWNATLNQENWEDHIAELSQAFNTPEEAKTLFDQHREFRQAFSNYQATIDHMIAEGNKVAVFQTVRATHVGEFPYGELKGIAPTGKTLEWTEASVVTLVNGKANVNAFIADGVSRLQQLGVLSSPQ